MKKNLHTALELLLVLLIFTGLQGRVIIRYAAFFHKNVQSEAGSVKGKHVRTAIVHCKLQCYTQRFHPVAVPAAISLFYFIILPFVIRRAYTPSREQIVFADPVLLLPPRAPPLF
jgi:hypothetical protein